MCVAMLSIVSKRRSDKFWNFQAGHRLRITVTGNHSLAINDAPPGTVTINSGDDSSYASVRILK